MIQGEHLEIFDRGGYVAAFSIKQIFSDSEVARFDVEVTLADGWRATSPRTTALH